MKTIDLSRLDLFVAVAEMASFSRAGDRMAVPKASVSRGIARLEADLGQQLFYRTTRRVTLTRAGHALYKRAAPQIVALRKAVTSLAEEQEQPSGVLRITAPNDLGTSFLADLTARFSARYPAVRLELELTSRHVDLVAEGFDVALRAAGRLADSSLIARKVSTVDIHLFASPSYLAQRGTPRTTRQLDGHDMVQFRGFRGPLRLRGPGHTVVCKLAARIVADDLSFVREALRAGAGIGLLPSFLARRDLASGTLVRVLPRYAAPQATLYLVHPAARHVPLNVVAFRDFVLQRLASEPIGPQTGSDQG
jgi:DNA-binding transcriptional LysR family regulator